MFTFDFMPYLHALALPAREAKKRAKGSATSAGTGPASRIITSRRGSRVGKAVIATNMAPPLREQTASARELRCAWFSPKPKK